MRACVYLRLVNDSGEVATPLVFGQSKVAPLQTTSIPRLELCGAVLATQAVARILKEIDIQIDDIRFYTDSKAALGFIQNESRRFYVFVANRIYRLWARWWQLWSVIFVGQSASHKGYSLCNSGISGIPKHQGITRVFSKKLNFSLPVRILHPSQASFKFPPPIGRGRR